AGIRACKSLTRRLPGVEPSGVDGAPALADRCGGSSGLVPWWNAPLSRLTALEEIGHGTCEAGILSGGYPADAGFPKPELTFRRGASSPGCSDSEPAAR